jgi:hypothetical protein
MWVLDGTGAERTGRALRMAHEELSGIAGVTSYAACPTVHRPEPFAHWLSTAVDPAETFLSQFMAAILVG